MIETPSTPLAVSQEIVNQDKRGIRVGFRWSEDRFSHSILGVLHGKAMPLLESIEGNAKDRFPPSPPLIELHQQDEAIFLTGATAAGHWSMSVEPVRAGKTVGFLFDVACRVKSLPDDLTSCYQKAESVEASPRDSSLILGTAWGGFRLESLPLPSAQEQSSCQLAFSENEVQLIRHTKGIEALPTTVRWRYQLIAT